MNESIKLVSTSGVNKITNGEQHTFGNKPCVYYEGYWIRRYDISQSAYGSYADKKRLIEMLTRRVFHNTEAGINMPGRKLNKTRAAYNNNKDPAQKRVNAAMLAGALLNRATDILTHVVELQKDGVEITSQNALIQQCGGHLMEALELGKQVKHYSGAEGIDELWGEPFKAFSQPIHEFYKSRYLKIGLSMAMIDHIGAILSQEIGEVTGFEKLVSKVNKFTNTAKLAVETVKQDPAFLELWPIFIAAGEELLDFKPELPENLTPLQKLYVDYATTLIKSGKDLITYISSARVPMPKSSDVYIKKCRVHAKEMQSAFSG